jgi:hypothetical protein
MGTTMGEHPELVIFRRYAALNVQNSLYMQAELQVPEIQLRQHANDDARSTMLHRQHSARDWETLVRSIAEQVIGTIPLPHQPRQKANKKRGQMTSSPTPSKVTMRVASK